MKVIYTFLETLEIEDSFELDPVDEEAVRNAVDGSERHEILGPLIIEHALERAALAVHDRNVKFGLDATGADR